MSLRIVFMGSPDCAVEAFERLIADGHSLCAVCQPDRGRVRGGAASTPPLGWCARECGVDVFQPSSVNAPEVLARLVSFDPDLYCVVAFGQILKPDTLAIPRLGAVNLHFSLLPRWRGAAPVEHAIWTGDEATGLTTQHVAVGLDEGDVILQEQVDIDPAETAGELLSRLSSLGAELLSHTVAMLEHGAAPRSPQDPTRVTWAPRLQPEQGALDLTQDSTRIGNHIRAFNPRPGCYVRFYEETVKVWRARPGEGSGDPGEVLGVGTDGLEVGTGLGSLVLTEVQPAGRARQTGRDFANGRRIQAGARFDPLPPATGTR